MTGRRLCHRDDIPDGQARGFTLGQGAERLAVLVVRRGDRVYGYENACPHLGTPLEWVPDRFMTLDGRYLQCATHGARFRVEDGVCLAGPCRGAALRPVPLTVGRAGDILGPQGPPAGQSCRRRSRPEDEIRNPTLRNADR